jgi:uncharacterized protein (TIGR02246 family)
LTTRWTQWRGRSPIVVAAWVLVIASLLSVGSAWARQTSDEVVPSAADEAAVRAVPQQVVEAWARGDGRGVAAAFSEDVAFIAGDGRLVRGREADAPYFQHQFDGWLAGSRAVANVESVRFLRDDVANVHTLGGIMFPGETTVQPNWVGIQTWVVVKKNGEWGAAAYQNSRVSPEVQAANPLSE